MKAVSSSQLSRLQQMLNAAHEAQKAGRLTQALQIYKQVLDAAPQAHDVRHHYAVLLASTGKPSEASKHFKLILKANPEHAATHANLGSALNAAGHFQEAIPVLRRALGLDGKLIWAHIHLADALRMSGSPEESIPHYERVLTAQPKHFLSLLGMGLAYDDLGNLPRALEYMEQSVNAATTVPDLRISFARTLLKAGLAEFAQEQLGIFLSQRPDSIQGLILQGETLQKLRQMEEAKQYFERALQLNPDEPELQERIAFAELELGHTEHAKTMFQDIVARHPERSVAILGLGRSHMEAGRTQEADAIFAQLIDTPSCHSDACYFLAINRKFKPDDPLIARLEALNESSPHNDRSSIALNFALGKIHDDCGNWDQAFMHFAAANRMRRQQLRYDKSLVTNRTDQLIATCTEQFLKEKQSIGSLSQRPILIIGMPRSGTTLVEQILSSHLYIAGGGELDFWDVVAKSFDKPAQPSAYPAQLANLDTEQATEISNRYLARLNNIAGASDVLRVTDKMPQNFLHLGMIAALFPHAYIIHCKRNPMDTCLSIFFQNFTQGQSYAYDLAEIGEYYREYERLMAHWDTALPERIFHIQYEELIENPEHWSRALITHVGLEWDAACLSPHKLKRSVQTASHWQIRQPIYNTSVQRWKYYESHLGPLKAALEITQ